MILGRITTGKDDPALRFYQAPRHVRYPIAIPQYRSYGFGAFRTEGGIVRPTDAQTLGQFQGLQRMLNVASDFASDATASPLTPLTVDGDIGPETLTRARRINQMMSTDPDVFLSQSAFPIEELVPFLRTTETLAQSASVVAGILGARLQHQPNFTADPATRPTPLPGPKTPFPFAPKQENGVGVGTMVIAGLLTLGVLGTIVYVAKRQ